MTIPVASPSPTKAKRILVVEDDETIRRVCASSLELCGFLVDEAGDGQAGYIVAQRNRYDLVITDNKMPKLSGLQMIAKLRAAKWDMPVILASGSIGDGDRNWPEALNVSAAIPKPYTAGQMIDAVNLILADSDRRDDQWGIDIRMVSQTTTKGLLSPRWGINE
jgi:CheY-like chemotaxis protein